MMRSVLPQARPRDVWLLTGNTDEVPSSTSRFPPLDAEERSDGTDEDDGWADDGDDGDASLHEGVAG